MNTTNALTIATNITIKMVNDYRSMTIAFPEFEWSSSGSACILSDGIAKQIGKTFGGHQLDGRGADLPSINWEVTAGKKIQKSHKLSRVSKFLWVRKLGKSWLDSYEIRFGEIDPEDFPTTKLGKHGSVVKKSISLSKLCVVYTGASIESL
jgi:hypothetical protein